MTTTPRRIRLTKRSIEALPTPTAEQGDTVCWDDALVGFGVRCLPSGTKTFVLQRRTRDGRSVRLKIARVGDLSCEQARDEAERLISRIVLGEDPAADRRKAREAERQRRLAATVADLCAAWQADRRAQWRPATEQEVVRQVERYILPKLGRRKAAEVRPAHVREIHDELTRAGAPVMSNRVVSTIRSMFSWAVRRDDWAAIQHNPAAISVMNEEHRRERYPQNGELARLVNVLHDRADLAGRFYQLLLLTGARRGELESMRWADVDLDAGVWTKPRTATKQKRSHRLPLSAEAAEVLRQVKLTEPFQPFARLQEHQLRKAWREILRAANITNLRVHDLRHWHASLLASMGLSLPIIGALLGHSNQATTQRYAHLLDDALRQAADRVGELVRLPIGKREG
jgi:integrase